ncbi:MAG: cytochrome c oxidase subunit 3 family protein [Labilithrix sp.]|nr:cytochrome c oxidase subunit 3 family protein [Labilithrix sp.]
MSTEAAATEHAEGAHDDHGHGHHGPEWLAHHFDTPAQQFDAAKLGMWAFLAQELLFFSGLFVAYGVYRSWFPEMFRAASHQLNKEMGAFNTVVLLFSSLTAALAVRSSQVGKKKATGNYILITILCACAFLVVKFFEYRHKFEAGLLPGRFYHPHLDHLTAGPPLPANTGSFFSIYFMMTGVHGVHVAVGIGVLIWIWLRNNRGDFSKEYFTPIDIVALYWHLVDLVWIYLFPLLYLI